MRNRDDVDRVRRVVEERCQTIGKKVALVVNYDNFLIDVAVADTYAAMVRYMETHYYTRASRYTTSAFLRLKLGEAWPDGAWRRTFSKARKKLILSYTP